MDSWIAWVSKPSCSCARSSASLSPPDCSTRKKQPSAAPARAAPVSQPVRTSSPPPERSATPPPQPAAAASSQKTAKAKSKSKSNSVANAKASTPSASSAGEAGCTGSGGLAVGSSAPAAPEALPTRTASPANNASPDSEASLVHYPGGAFNGLHCVDLAAAPYNFNTVLGGALSISFVARWDAFHSWSRVVDFGSGPQMDNIIIANYEKQNTLCADVYRGVARKRLLISACINVGELNQYMLTISESGCMKMYRDSVLIGELQKGYAPKSVERSYLYVGRSNSSGDGTFQGNISDLKLWSRVVEWTTAFP